MGKITKAGSPRPLSNLLYFILVIFSIHFSASAYTDQIAIETPSAVKTIYDIRVHAFLRHLYEDKKITDTISKEWLQGSFENERTSYIGQFLVQSYVTENGLTLKSTPEEIAQATQKIKQVFPTQEAREKAFSELNIADPDVQQWVTNRLVYEKFMTTMIQDRVILTDEKLKSHYEAWKAKRFGNKPYELVQEQVKQDLLKTLIDEEFVKWFDQEKTREKMILKMVSVS